MKVSINELLVTNDDYIFHDTFSLDSASTPHTSIYLSTFFPVMPDWMVEQDEKKSIIQDFIALPHTNIEFM